MQGVPPVTPKVCCTRLCCCFIPASAVHMSALNAVCTQDVAIADYVVRCGPHTLWKHMFDEGSQVMANMVAREVRKRCAGCVLSFTCWVLCHRASLGDGRAGAGQHDRTGGKTRPGQYVGPEY